MHIYNLNEKDYSKGILSLMFFRINFLPDLAGKVMSKKAEYVSMENAWYTWKNLGQGNNTISVSTILKPRRTYRDIFENGDYFSPLLAFLPWAPNCGFPVSGDLWKRLIIVFAKTEEKRNFRIRSSKSARDVILFVSLLRFRAVDG